MVIYYLYVMKLLYHVSINRNDPTSNPSANIQDGS